jgi:la-related protein 1
MTRGPVPSLISLFFFLLDLVEKMDAHGWIPIPLIASFNRVRHLTLDEHLVKDVLQLSSVVEVAEDYVRMVGWQRFVLPEAARGGLVESASAAAAAEADAEEEEEEEEVEFVMGREAGWAPDPMLQPSFGPRPTL